MWLNLRLTLYLAAFVLVMVRQPTDMEFYTHPFFVGFGLISFAVIPFLLGGFIRLVAAYPWNTGKWTPPTHRDNPIQLSNPLPILHTLIFANVAAGLGAALSAAWRGWPLLAMGASHLLAAYSAWLGLRLGMRWCSDKMVKTDGRSCPRSE